jgi:hypothetical protein
MSVSPLCIAQREGEEDWLFLKIFMPRGSERLAADGDSRRQIECLLHFNVNSIGLSHGITKIVRT